VRKLLGLTALVTLFVLGACGGNSTDETVCTADFFGSEMVATVQSEDNTITSATIVLNMDVSDWDEEEIEEEMEWMAEDDESSCELDGETLICSIEFDKEDLEEEFSLDLAEFIEDMESEEGATCVTN
jgi:hypothetical protein